MLKALRAFSVTYTTETDTKMLLTFEKGDLIYDPRVARTVLSLGCPVAGVGNHTAVSCPRCGEQFDSTEHTTTATVPLVNTRIPFNAQFFSFAAGDIIVHPWLVEALKAADVPLEAIVATECPTCHTIFR